MVPFTCLILILALTGCGGGKADDATSVPTVALECSTAQVNDCSLNNKEVFAGLIEDLVMNCDNTLKGLNASQREALFAVSGSATSSRNGIYLTATIDSWVNSTGGRQDVLNDGTYKVCAFVDSNGNGQLDATEPVGEGQVDAGQGYYIVGTWAAGS